LKWPRRSRLHFEFDHIQRRTVELVLRKYLRQRLDCGAIEQDDHVDVIGRAHFPIQR
jgi:hypothetical protein